MKQLNNYIIEKLKLNKNINTPDKDIIYPGDTVHIIQVTSNNTGTNSIKIHYEGVCLSNENNTISVGISFEDKNFNAKQKYENVIINSNKISEAYEYRSPNTKYIRHCYLIFKDAKKFLHFLQDIILGNCINFNSFNPIPDEKTLFKYFDKNDNFLIDIPLTCENKRDYIEAILKENKDKL